MPTRNACSIHAHAKVNAVNISIERGELPESVNQLACAQNQWFNVADLTQTDARYSATHTAVGEEASVCLRMALECASTTALEHALVYAFSALCFLRQIMDRHPESCSCKLLHDILRISKGFDGSLRCMMHGTGLLPSDNIISTTCC